MVILRFLLYVVFSGKMITTLQQLCIENGKQTLYNGDAAFLMRLVKLFCYLAKHVSEQEC